MTDDNSVIVVGDNNNNINIYSENADTIDLTESKSFSSSVSVVDITGDGEWLYTVSFMTGSILYRK